MLRVNVVETMPFTRAIRKIAASLLPAASQLLLLMKWRPLVPSYRLIFLRAGNQSAKGTGELSRSHGAAATCGSGSGA